MKKIALISAVLMAGVLAGSASADLRLAGDVRPRHHNWIAAASVNVPIPDAKVWLFSGFDPEYDPVEHDILLPQPGWGGWTYQAEHYLLLHELGHVVDFTYLTPADRTAFKQAIGSPCQWWSKNCKPPRNPNLSVPPGERFAEAYAACALGETRRESDLAGNPSYGWDPPVDDGSLCLLIRGLVA